MTTPFDERLDEILQNFAKRIENIPQGKTYGWEDEKQAILSLFREMVEEIIGEEYSVPMNENMVWMLTHDERTKARNELRAEQRANLLQQLGEKKHPTEIGTIVHET